MPYRDAFEAIKPAVSILMMAGIDVGLYNYPLCAVEQGYWPLCARSISDYKIRYARDCEACVVRDACGGLFAGSKHIAEADIEPIRSPKAVHS